MTTPITCAICDHQSHILASHITYQHGMTVVEYMQEYQAPWYSEYGRMKLAEKFPEQMPAQPRERKSVKLATLFKEFKDLEDEYDIFAEPTPSTPVLDPAYVFPEDQTLEFLTVIEKPKRNNIYISGYSGTGKTQLAHNLASICNAGVSEMNADKFVTRARWFGQHRLHGNKEMYFAYGVIPRAMKAGHWLIINELDTAGSEAVNMLKPLLEDTKRIRLSENDDELIQAHPDFRVIVTCNTWARGDDSGLFVNTETQSAADLRRFSAFIELNYLEPEVEAKILEAHVPNLSNTAVDKFIKVANAIREAYINGRILRTFSPAELVNWAENYTLFCQVHRAARVSFLRSYDPEEQVAVMEIIQTHWGQEDTSVL